MLKDKLKNIKIVISDDNNLFVNGIYITYVGDNRVGSNKEILIDVIDSALDGLIFVYMDSETVESLAIKSRICYALDIPDSLQSLKKLLEEMENKNNE